MTDHQAARVELQRAERTPIAQLRPNIADPNTRVVEGEVTITWPFSIVTKSISFKLVESDFRLRLDKGQVRVDFHGAAGKAVAKAAVGGGDDIQLSLDGVEWEKAQAPVRPDTLEWQLKFTNRLRLKIRRAESREEELIEVQASEGDEEGPAIQHTAAPIEPIEPTTPVPTSTADTIPLPKTAAAALPTKRLASSAFDSDEYASPAFLKRARVSYGSLFEGGLELFDDERKDLGKKKRSRFSMHANWRYASRTPSPEPQHQDELDEDNEPEFVEDRHHAEPVEASPRPPMVDEGSQTQVANASPTMPTQFAVETLPASRDTPSSPTPVFSTRPHAIEDENTSFIPIPMFGAQQEVSELPTSTVPASIAMSEATVPAPQELDHSLSPEIDMSNGTSYHGPFHSGTGAQDVTRDAPELAEQPEADEEPKGLPETNEFFTTPMDFQAATQPPGLDAEQPSKAEEFPHDIANQPPTFAPSQLEQASWSALTSMTSQPPIHDPNSIDNPVEIIDSSSPARAPSPNWEHDTREFEEQQREASAPEEEGADEPPEMGYMQAAAVPADSDNESMHDEVDLEEDDEDKDSGDVDGEDYDLRNYDDAQDDDVAGPQESADEEADKSDTDEQVVDVEAEESEQSEREDEEEEEQEAEVEQEDEQEMEQGMEQEEEQEEEQKGGEERPDGDGEYHMSHQMAELEYPDEDVDVDADGEEYEEYEEEEYDGEPYEDEGEEEEEEEEESDYDKEEQASPQPAVPQEPVFISLLSDSEDEDEDEDEQDETLAAAPATATQDGDSNLEETLDERPEPEAVVARSEAAPCAFEEPGLKNPLESEEQKRSGSHEQQDHMVIDGEPPQAYQPTGEVEVNDFAHDGRAMDNNNTTNEMSVSADEEADHVESRGRPAASTDAEATHIPDKNNSGIEEDRGAAENVAQASGENDVELVGLHVVNGVEQLLAGGDSSSPPSNKQVVSSLVNMEAQPGPDHEVETKGVSAQPVVEELPKEPSAPEEHIATATDSYATQAETMKPSDLRAEERSTRRSSDVGEVVMAEAAPSSSKKDKQISTIHEDNSNFNANETKLNDRPTTMSPPLTQPHQVDTAKEAQDVTAEDVETMAGAKHSGQLPTPGETQQDEDTAMHDEEMEASEAEYSFAAEQQIMAESQAYEASQQQRAEPEPSRETGERDKQTSADTDGQRMTRSKSRAKPERDILITAQSLRSWDQRKSTSSVGTDDDPSIALAKAPEETAKQETALEEKTAPPIVRVTRSKAEDEDPSVQLAKKSRTPSRRGHRDMTPEASRETRERRRSLRSKTPDSTAEILKSPSVTESITGNEEASTLKQKLVNDLRTNHPDFLSLKALRHNLLNKTADFIGVATTTPGQPHRPKGGPRDYMLELTLIDPASAPSSVSVALIYRPHQASLPTVQAGDIVLLRQFEVVSVKGRGFGIRACDASAWAVFEKGDEEMLPQIKGPPVEMSEQEFSYAEEMRRWWGLLDTKAMEKIEKVTQRAIQAGKESKA